MKPRTSILAALGLAVALGGVASAQTPRDQVNARIAHQNERIHEARVNGEISPRKAHRLHMAERRIRRHERRYAFLHNGHISRHEQMKLNREENRASDRIGQ